MKKLRPLKRGQRPFLVPFLCYKKGRCPLFEETRLRRFMKISPKKKLEWLRQMQEFNAKYLSKKVRAIHLKLKKALPL